MTVAVNNVSVMSGTISMPAYGAWHARLKLDAEDASSLAGQCTISIEGGASLIGTAYRSGVFEGRVEAWIVGGANGLSVSLPAKFYDAAPARTIATDIARESGETLSATADAATLSTLAPKWMRIAGTAGRALSTLTTHLGVTWRMLDDGSIWIGLNTWTPFSGDYDIIDTSSSDDRTTIADDTLALRADMSIDGRNVSYVQHMIEPDSLRTEAWLA